jgi:hypothetical protein
MTVKFHKSLAIKNRKVNFLFERYSKLSGINSKLKSLLVNDVKQVLENSWGIFPDDFVKNHIFNADEMFLARESGVCVGLCVMSIRNVLGLKVHYIEFLLVDRKFQGYGLGNFLSQRMIRSEIIKNLFSILAGEPLEIFFITPNIRVLSNSARHASFIYPNPYLADENGNIPPADEKTWEIALDLLKKSDNPGRKLERNGLVLHDSYADTPWLIYNNDNAPWNNDEKINLFAKNYLGYHSGEDREFMVRMQINFTSIIRYLFS